MNLFDQKASMLHRIERGEENYGEGSAAEQALRFYLDELLDKAVTRALARSDHHLAQPVRLLISLSGFSPLTTILAYEMLRPEQLLVLFSEGNRSGIDSIADHVVGRSGLRYSNFMARPCVPTDPHGVYRLQIIRIGLHSGRGPLDASEVDQISLDRFDRCIVVSQDGPRLHPR